MTETFDCNICCDTKKLYLRKKLQKLVCPKCGESCCLNCQQQYAKDACMNCNFEFKESFLRNLLGANFIKNVVKPRVIE